MALHCERGSHGKNWFTQCSCFSCQPVESSRIRSIRHMTAPPQPHSSQATTELLRAHVRIVLVAPEYPGNVGSTARAMSTMGLTQLYVVNPVCNPLADEAYWLAHAAADVLSGLRVVPTLEEALADTVFSIGTSRRQRRQHFPFFTPDETANTVLQKMHSGPVALVFGRESSGLSNDELELCSAQSCIMSVSEDHSLNLAQAVMVYCYVLYQQALLPHEREFALNLAHHAELQALYGRIGEAIAALGLQPATTMENFVDRFRRVFGRVPMESRDVRLLLKFLSRTTHVIRLLQEGKSLPY